MSFADGGSVASEARTILHAAAAEWESMRSVSAFRSLIDCYEYQAASRAAQSAAVLMLARGLESHTDGAPDLARQAEAWAVACGAADCAAAALAAAS